MIYVRNCPLCGREIIYTNYEDFEKAIEFDEKCKRCRVFFNGLNKRISKETKYQSYFEKKLYENFFRKEENEEEK